MQGNQRAVRDVAGRIFRRLAHIQHQRFGFLIQLSLHSGRLNAWHRRAE